MFLCSLAVQDQDLESGLVFECNSSTREQPNGKVQNAGHFNEDIALNTADVCSLKLHKIVSFFACFWHLVTNGPTGLTAHNSYVNFA